jgi:glycosyltransferase involved in cell wall biosynthesis
MVEISVLTTVFNRSNYIAQCIESVLASSYQNWEMIIVDDCSIDNSVEIAKEFEKKDPRIKVYVNEINLGDYPNRNKAASYATGKYLKYLDADDLIYPHCLEVMVNAMERFPDANFGTQHILREANIPYPFLISSVDAFRAHYLETSFYQSGPTGTIIKREAFEQLGGFSGRRHIGDTEMWLKLSLKSPIVVFQPALIWWRQHEGQEIKKELKNTGIQIERIQFDIEELIENKHLLTTEGFIRAYKKKRQHLTRYALAVLLKQRNFQVFLNTFKYNKFSMGELLRGFFPYSK